LPTQCREIDLALDDLRRAVALRHGITSFGTALGASLDKKGTPRGVDALTEAEARAPFYARPHWQAGLLLQK